MPLRTVREMSEPKLEQALKLKASGNYTEAIQILLSVSSDRNHLAQWHLADCYENGPANVRDLELAKIWYEKASLSDELWFSHSLARFFERQGRENEAFDMVSRLAAEGYQPSIFRLGRYLEDGYGTARNHREALRQIELAASRGHVFAQRAIAMRTMRGEFGLFKAPLGLLSLVKVLIRIIALGAQDPWDPRIVN